MYNKKIVTYLVAFLSTQLVLLAQGEGSGPAMADLMRSSGKIYVVVATIVLMLVVIIALLLLYEKRIKKLEEKVGK